MFAIFSSDLVNEEAHRAFVPVTEADGERSHVGGFSAPASDPAPFIGVDFGTPVSVQRVRVYAVSLPDSTQFGQDNGRSATDAAVQYWDVDNQEFRDALSSTGPPPRDERRRGGDALLLDRLAPAREGEDGGDPAHELPQCGVLRVRGSASHPVLGGCGLHERGVPLRHVQRHRCRPHRRDRRRLPRCRRR
jgi:hypothetical protein